MFTEVCVSLVKKKLSCFFLFRGRPFLPCHCTSSTPALLRFFTLNLVHPHCLSKLPSPSIQQALSLLQAAASVVVDPDMGEAAVFGACCYGHNQTASRWWGSTKGGDQQLLHPSSRPEALYSACNSLSFSAAILYTHRNLVISGLEGGSKSTHSSYLVNSLI